MSSVCNITLSGNTAANGSGTSWAVQETLETSVQNATYNTATASTSYTNNGTIATNNLNLNISWQFTLTITKASNVGSYPRNFYSFTTVYSVGGVGTVKTSGVGRLDSTALASIILTPSTGNLTGTYSTIHYSQISYQF